MQSKSKAEIINQRLKSLFTSLKETLPEFFPNNDAHLKKAILKTSDQFLFKENKSQWEQDWFQIGYLNYFLPMQYSRIHKALSKVLEVSPDLEERIKSVIDFGSGPGPSALVFNDLFKIIPKWTNIDENKNPHKMAKAVYSSLKIKNTNYSLSSKIPLSAEPDELIIFSYSLCEGINEENIFSYDHIFILEPSTKESSRKLLNLRKQAIENGFNVLAPCTHCLDCPMLERKNDWCHDRALKPDLEHIKNLKLPFSNTNLSYSYLFLSKTISSSVSKNQSLEGLTQKDARVIGDFLKEKGKTKVAVCYNNERRFLSWLKRSKYSPDFSRGDLIKIPSNSLIKGQEIRISAD